MAGALARQEVVRAHVPALAMANRFGKYMPEEEKAVRKIDVQGDELTYLRQRREMLRSMTPEQALQVIEFHPDLDVFQALDLAKREGKLIVPNDVHDRILTETDKRPAAWTGTAGIYEAPGKPFGEKVVYSRENGNVRYTLSFDIPQQFIGKTNCALVVEHPDFEIIPLGNNNFQLKVAEGSVSLLDDFPKATQEWYEYDKRFRIPTGTPNRYADSTPKRYADSTRRLWRINSAYVGLVARGGCSNWTTFDLGGAPSYGLGVAVF